MAEKTLKTQRDDNNNKFISTNVDNRVVSQVDLQDEIRKQRNKRLLVMTMLVFALILTVVYGTLESPISYTLSNIGNFFNYRIFFIVWAIVAGLAIQTAILAMFRLEGWNNPYALWFTALSSLFLIMATFIPAIKTEYPFWHLLHTICAGLHAFFILLAFTPFIRWLTKENPRLRLFSNIWFLVIWVGSFLIAVFLGKSGLFELWFFVSLILYLLYFSVVMFEERIILLTYEFVRETKNHEMDFEIIFSKTPDEL